MQSNEIKKNAYFTVTSKIENSRKIINEIINHHPNFTREEVFKCFISKIPNPDSLNFSVDDLVNSYSRICQNEIALAKEIPLAEETLIYLKKKSKSLYISSATPFKHLKRLLHLRGILKYFNGFYGHPKTKHEHIQEIKKKEKIDLDKIIYIGDSEIDRFSAAQAGCGFIGIGNDNSRFNKNPKILINNYKYFLKHISS